MIVASELYETFGIAIPESFSLSIPVIATNLGNPMFIVEKSQGGLSNEIQEYDSFYKTLFHLMENRNIYLLNAFYIIEMN